MKSLFRLPAFVRFVLVGGFATAFHYGLYLLLRCVIEVNLAYTIGYVLSFVANFYLTAWFTFQRSPSWRRGQLPDAYGGLQSLPLDGSAVAMGTIAGLCHRGSSQLSAR